jgi:hypothetical protein
MLALVIGFEAFRALFAPLMVLSYRLGDIGVTQALGGLTPGDDYRRFIPLMDTVPGWLLGGVRRTVSRGGLAAGSRSRDGVRPLRLSLRA